MVPRETPSHPEAAASVEIPQYTVLGILAVWAAAALPMAALAWLVAPALADELGGEENVPMAKALLICLTAGLIWQFVLVVILVSREQRTLRWPIVREALWLRSPRNPRSGRVGGRVWLIVIPLSLLFAAESAIRTLQPRRTATSGSSSARTSVKPSSAAPGAGLASSSSPRSSTPCSARSSSFAGPAAAHEGRLRTWRPGSRTASLFAGYHLHVPWVIPVTLLDTFILALPWKYFRSAWIGIVVHSAQSLFITIVILTLVI